MKIRLSLLSAALVSILLPSPASAGTVELFHETFDSNDQNWSYTSSGQPVYDKTWSVVDGSVYPGYKGVKIGTTTVEAHLKTGVVTPINQVGDIFITVCAAAYTNSAGTQYVKVDVVDSSDAIIVSFGGQANGASLPKHSSAGKVEIPYTGNFVKTFTLSSGDIPASGGIALVFTSESSNQSQKRLLLGDVLVEQNVPPLSAPANLAVSGTVGANDFAVAWDASTDAQGYSVKLLDANDGVVSSNDVAAATTGASFTGLTSSSAYTVVVVALGNHATTDDSAPATLPVTTAASSAAAPTLDVAVTGWTAGVAGTSAVSATLEGGVACTVESVSMSDGSTATVANGVLSWTPPAANAASIVTATFHVTGGGDGWNLSQVLSVSATPAPGAPSVTLSGATPRSFDASWSATAGGPVVSYKLRAWTGRETPDDATGSASEDFAGFVADGTVPAGWTFVNAEAYTGSTYAAYPVGFKSVSGSATSPDYGAALSSVSFRLRAGTGSFAVSAAPSGSDDWTVVANYTTDAGTFTTESKTVALDESAGYSKIKLEFERTGGSAAFGTFAVSGADWPAADFLEGWGGAKVSVGAATSQTISDPVAGQVNYVEVTAVGPTGRSTSAVASIAVPAESRKAVILVK